MPGGGDRHGRDGGQEHGGLADEDDPDPERHAANGQREVEPATEGHRSGQQGADQPAQADGRVQPASPGIARAQDFDGDHDGEDRQASGHEAVDQVDEAQPGQRANRRPHRLAEARGGRVRVGDFAYPAIERPRVGRRQRTAATTRKVTAFRKNASGNAAEGDEDGGHRRTDDEREVVEAGPGGIGRPELGFVASPGSG